MAWGTDRAICQGCIAEVHRRGKDARVFAFADEDAAAHADRVMGKIVTALGTSIVRTA